MKELNKILDLLEEEVTKQPLNNALSKKIGKLSKSKLNNLFSMSQNYMQLILKDNQRTLFYKCLVDQFCAAKNIIEIGTGAGLLSYLTLKAKPNSFISCDGSSENISLADQFLKKNNLQNYKLINKSSYDLEIPKDIDADKDIIIHELYASNGFGENFLQTLKNSKRFLNSTGRIIPGIFKLYYLPTTNQTQTSLSQINDVLPELDLSIWEGSHYLSKTSHFKCYLDSPKLVFEIDLNSDYPLYGEKIIDLPDDCTGVMLYFKASEGAFTMTTLLEGGANHFFARSFGEGIYRQFSKKSSKVLFKFEREQFQVSEID